MSIFTGQWYQKYLACPDCQATLYTNNDISCSHCDYKQDQSKPISLKPKHPKSLTIELPRLLATLPSNTLAMINLKPPKVTYNGPPAIRDSSELISEISRHIDKGSYVLDLGCGPRDQFAPIHHIGCQYVGMDYSNSNADFLADAHAIPFKDSTFDCVLSYAVLEHLHNPFIALTEIERVLKPGGIYIGTVSQGEPFHDSFFHHTAWGFISLVSSISRLKIIRLWSSGDTLESLARMGRYPRIIRQLLNIVNKITDKMPFLAPRKMKWPEKEKDLDFLYRAGSICFVVQKLL